VARPGHRRGRHRVVVVGGGFGGLACVRALEREPVDVLLLDAHNYHLFTPLLYQVATSLLNASEIAYPFRTIFRRAKNVRFRQTRVDGVDLDGKLVRTQSGDEIPYDGLVMATGSENNYFSNQELAADTLGMKTLGEAMRLRNHVLSCLEFATRAAKSDERRQWLTFVIAGGGPTGVEYAGALSELLGIVLGRDYPELDRSLARIVLVEGKDHLLGGFHPKLGAYARRILNDRGIEVRPSTLVRKATDEGADLSDGEEIPTRTIVWSAGVRPTDPLEGAKPERSRTGRLLVDEHLELLGHQDVWVIGDAASVTEDGGELPMLSPPAMQAGRYVARAIVARAAGVDGPRKPFRYEDKGTMATIGRGAAVADSFGIQLEGTMGWMAWLLVHVYYLIGFRNRAAVLASWAGNYIRRDRPIRLILRSDPDAVEAALERGVPGPNAKPTE
jgi:NADH:ubiquinone reductase (H+-translocating)